MTYSNLLQKASPEPLSKALELTATDWAKRLASYRQPDLKKAVFEIAVTVIPFFGLWIAAALALEVSLWLSVLICVPTAFFLVRLFTIQHDCGHGSFFKSKRLNDTVGNILGVLTVTPYYAWKRSHREHHMASGNLDNRGMGAVDTLTVTEFREKSFWGRAWYRFYRNPFTLFVIGPAFVFLFQHRFPFDFQGTGQGLGYWASSMGTNLGMLALAAVAAYFVGWQSYLIVFLTTTTLAATIGVWLFYVQHQFEDAHWRRNPDWDMREAALFGSSFYDLPQPLAWLAGNIGVHHVHHLNSRIPLYRLQQTLVDYPELKSINRMTLRTSVATVNLHLWDEARGKLVSFKTARHLA